MINTLILAASLASQCTHHVHHKAPGLPALALDQCSSVLPYPQWQPRDNEDSLPLGDMEPLTTGPLTKYLTITQTEPCHVYSNAGGGLWSDLTSGGGGGGALPHVGPFRAPEIDPAGLVAGLTMLAAGVAVIRGGRNRK